MADEHFEDGEQGPASSGGLPSWALPVSTAAIALLLGALIGGVAVGLAPNEPTLVEVARDLTPEEIAEVCETEVEEAVADAATDLESAQEQVRTLEARVAAKQKQVDALETEMARRADRGRELVAELERVKAELVDLEVKLERAIEEKEALAKELKQTKVALTAQKARTREAKEDALNFKWRTFVGNAQLTICEKGGRKKMGRCRETVAVSLGPAVRSSFEHCIRAGQELPLVSEVTKDSPDLPMYADWIDQEARVTRDWYVQLCDPTLPEAEVYTPPSVDRTATKAAETEDDDELLLGDEDLFGEDW